MKKLFFLVYLVTVSLLLLEGIVRIWGYSAHCIYDPIYMPYAKSEEIPYIQKPNLNNAKARGYTLINTDSLGLRAASVGEVYGPKKANQIRIAVIGDSVTFGEGVPCTEETYAAVLEKILNKMLEGNQVQVFNFGVSAYSVREIVATLRYRVEQVQPDLVIAAIVPEDFTLSRVGVVDKWGYTVHTNTTGIIGEDSVLKKILRKVHLTYFVRDIISRYCANGERDINDTIAPGFPITVPMEAYQYVLRLRDTTEQMEIPYLLLLLPPINHTFDSTFLEQLHRDRIVFLDLDAIKQEFIPEIYNASRFDHHLSPTVHRRIAEEVASYIPQWVK